MYKENPEFIIDKTKDLPLWRYMDFWKFLKIINSSTLFFPNVEMMGDQFEGKIPQKAYQWMLDKYDKDGRRSIPEDYKKYVENELRRKMLILSWNANHSESFAF